MSFASREQRIAHLEIHGWEPVRDGPKDPRRYSGVWHAELNIGFAQSRSMAGSWIIQLVGDWHYPTRCEWDEVTDEVLAAIDARLAET